MANLSIHECRSAVVTPTNSIKFQFPPQICKSADRLVVVPNFDRNVYEFRRSFTPIDNRLFLQSPGLSPINGSLIMESPDTTVNISMDGQGGSQPFLLMPPPKGRPRRTANYLSLNRELSPLVVYGAKNLQKAENKISSDDILNTNVSLNSLLKDTGLDQYIDLFEMAQIDLEILFTLCDQDLKNLGIKNDEDREILLKFKNIFESSFS